MVNKACFAQWDKTKYPNLNFLAEDLRASFISNMRFEHFTLELPGLPADFRLEDRLAEVIPDPEKYLFLSNNFKLPNAEQDLKNKLPGTNQTGAVLVMDLVTSVWRQDLQGTYSFYSLTGKRLWKEKVEVVSTYIVRDSSSPYLSDYDKLYGAYDPDADFKSELVKIYRELGSLLAEQLKSSYLAELD